MPIGFVRSQNSHKFVVANIELEITAELTFSFHFHSPG